MNLEIPLEAMPPTPVTLATLSMETLPGLVGTMDLGVAVNQLVIVSLDISYASQSLRTLSFSC